MILRKSRRINHKTKYTQPLTQKAAPALKPIQWNSPSNRSLTNVSLFFALTYQTYIRAFGYIIFGGSCYFFFEGPRYAKVVQPRNSMCFQLGLHRDKRSLGLNCVLRTTYTSPLVCLIASPLTTLHFCKHEGTYAYMLRQ